MGGAGWGCWLVGARDERRGVVCGEGWSGVHGCCLHKGGGDRGGQGLPAQRPSGSCVQARISQEACMSGGVVDRGDQRVKGARGWRRPTGHGRAGPGAVATSSSRRGWTSSRGAHAGARGGQGGERSRRQWVLVQRALARCVLARQALARRVLAGQALARRVLARRVLARRVLARQALARRVLARRMLARREVESMRPRAVGDGAVSLPWKTTNQVTDLVTKQVMNF